jgi:hypothetical protein
MRVRNFKLKHNENHVLAHKKQLPRNKKNRNERKNCIALVETAIFILCCLLNV